MGLFERFPYTNFHDLNLTWILNELKTLEHTINEFVSINALKYADPIQWNIVTQYEKNTIVIDPLTGTAYISVQPVPSGVALTNTDYWTVVFDLGSFVVRAAKNFTDKFEEETTLTATFPSAVNDWLIWGDVLYRVLSPITAGDQYVVNSNIIHFTAEDVIGHIQDLNTTDQSNLVAAINELDLERANLKIYNVVDYGAVADGVTDCTQAFNDTIAAFNLTGGVIYIPTGAYIITDVLDPITAKGVIIGNASTLNVTLSSGTDILFDISVSDFSIENISFYGNAGIAIQTARLCKITHCDFVGFTYGINIDNSVGVIIDSCYFVNASSAGIYITNESVDSGDNRITNCTWDKSASAPNYNGIVLDSGGGLIVSSCKFLNVFHAFHEVISVPSTSVLIFTGNSCEGGVSSCLSFRSTLNAAPFGKCIITNNEIKGSSECIQIFDYSNAFQISGNYFEGGNVANIYSIVLGDPNSIAAPRNIVIANNLERFFQGFVYTYRNIPELDIHGNSLDIYMKNIINSNHATVSQETYHNFVYEDVVGVLASATDEIQFWMYPNSICNLNVKLGDSVSDELDVIMIADSSAITVTTRGASINNKLSVTVSGLMGVVKVQPTTETTAAITVKFEGQIKRILDVNT